MTAKCNKHTGCLTRLNRPSVACDKKFPYTYTMASFHCGNLWERDRAWEGLTPSESAISWTCWPTGVCSAKHQCTCPTAVSRSPKSQHVGIYAPLHVISWPFRDIVSALTVVGHSLSLVRWRSTLCQMIYEIPLSVSARQPSNDRWRYNCSLSISTFSALGCLK